MSASTIVVQVAAVCSDSTIARPIDRRMRDNGAEPACIGAGSGSAAGCPKRGLRFLGAVGSSGR